ncbi:hypothetical protein SanaruYs_31080 [Chryseotalea sanaruensis]|uniref:AprE-like beta-barrel domain-containing protein n=1 Tax=Chryseotalea sanaruensis TaxID=2482724 RepID=A0A401UDB7_9BACT|nr:HlyD family efflux transporter periplasmic adaptor subunit [Chryseotalea sanaruensis]GCC52869.1 hypothetical protein SanaruYs_31080 [Chryseotalea sanaruensis]
MEEFESDNRSEAVRDYLEKMPRVIIRIGTYVIAAIFILISALTILIQYPTIVKSDFRLTSKVSIKPVIVRSNGRLEKLFVKESEVVLKGQILGWVESSANHQEILDLEKELSVISELFFRNEFNKFSENRLADFKSLGEIQMLYQEFQQHYTKVILLYSDKFYESQRNILLADLNELNKMKRTLEEQGQLFKRDSELASNEFLINQKLYNEKVITSMDIDREESKSLAKKIPLKNLEMLIINNNSLILKKQGELLDLERNLFEDTEKFKQSLNSLVSSIVAWRKEFLLVSPSNGIIHFSGILQESQYLTINSEVFYVGPSSSSFFGEINIPQNNFGKVQIGQRVIIKLHGYPYEEFGTMEGSISSIAEFSKSNKDFFYATVSLRENLRNSKVKDITLKDGMLATAEIITEDLTLAERIFYSFKKNLSSR